MTTTIRTRATVGEDGKLEVMLSGELPPGEHEVVITVEEASPAKRKFRVKDFPVNDTPWDDSISLRREDMYGDDGR